jgi:hypothetical protein
MKSSYFAALLWSGSMPMPSSSEPLPPVSRFINLHSCILAFMSNRPTTEERLGKSPQRLARYFVLLMALVYLGLGVWLWWTADTATSGGIIELGPTARRVLGSVLILYGLVRFGRAYQVHFRDTSISDSDNHE